MDITNSKLLIIITGGTIDGLNYDSLDKKPKGQKSIIPNLLKLAKMTIDYEIVELMMKDSRFIEEKERQIILKFCRTAREDKIIITHGTMTMSGTAKFLGIQKLPKTIVMTGAMRPASQKGSDGMFNLGAAITAVQTLPQGVYITMNGEIFSWNNVRKNKKKHRFEKKR